MNLSQNEQEMLEHIICQMEEETGLDRNSAIADMRFHYIEKVCEAAVIRLMKAKNGFAVSRSTESLPENIPEFQHLLLLWVWSFSDLQCSWCRTAKPVRARNWKADRSYSSGNGDVPCKRSITVACH